MSTIFILAKIILTLAAGTAAGLLTVFVFNRIPARWLCDYDQEPSREMWDERVRKKPWLIVFVLLFIAAALKLSDDGFLYAAPGLIAIWLLVQIAMADRKYMIIPDQLVIALAVTAFGFIPFQDSFRFQLLGALAGGGSLLVIGLIGSILFRKDAMGFGDVKLMSAVGLVCGLRGIVIVFILTIFSSALVFSAGLISGKLKSGDQQPLGPFIAAAAALYILFRPEFMILVDFY